MRGTAVVAALFVVGCGSSDALDAGWQGNPADATFPDAGLDFADAYPTADPDPDAWSPSPTFTTDASTSFRCTGKTLGSGSRDENVMSGGLSRVAHLHIPASYDPTAGTMLVLAFHGFFETGSLQEVQSRMDPSSDSKGYIVAYPEGIASSWNAGDCCGDSWTNSVDDVQFTRDLLAAITAASGTGRPSSRTATRRAPTGGSARAGQTWCTARSTGAGTSGRAVWRSPSWARARRTSAPPTPWWTSSWPIRCRNRWGFSRSASCRMAG